MLTRAERTQATEIVHPSPHHATSRTPSLIEPPGRSTPDPVQHFSPLVQQRSPLVVKGSRACGQDGSPQANQNGNSQTLAPATTATPQALPVDDRDKVAAILIEETVTKHIVSPKSDNGALMPQGVQNSAEEITRQETCGLSEGKAR
jgi:hypothetical protein